MALALEAINTTLINEIRRRKISASTGGLWLSKSPYMRATSYAVPKYRTGKPHIDNLRTNNVLSGGYLWDGSNVNPDYGYGNNSYRTTTKTGYVNEIANVSSTSRKYAPTPGIVSLSVSNKGAMGSLRQVIMQIKAYDVEQLDTLEALYMTPGIGILVEWGWSYSRDVVGQGPTIIQPKFQSTDEAELKQMKKNQTALSNIVKDGTGTIGDYDACVATITNYNWNANKDGSYDIQVEAVSRGESLLSMPINKGNSKLLEVLRTLMWVTNDKSHAEDAAICNQYNIPIFESKWAQGDINKEIKAIEKDLKLLSKRRSANVALIADQEKTLSLKDVHFMQCMMMLHKHRLRTIGGKPCVYSDTDSKDKKKEKARALYDGHFKSTQNLFQHKGDFDSPGDFKIFSYINSEETTDNHSTKFGLKSGEVGFKQNGKLYRPFFVSQIEFDSVKDGETIFQKNKQGASTGYDSLSGLLDKITNNNLHGNVNAETNIARAHKFLKPDGDINDATILYQHQSFIDHPDKKPPPELFYDIPANKQGALSGTTIDMADKSDVQISVGGATAPTKENGDKKSFLEHYIDGLYGTSGLGRIPFAQIHEGDVNMLAPILYAYVDFQEWDPVANTFMVFSKTNDASFESKRIETFETSTNKVDVANATNSQIDHEYQLKDSRLKALQNTVGTYIPLWSVEYLLNNTSNLIDSSGQRVFRYDSGFIKYDEIKDKLLVESLTVKTDKEKTRILTEYKHLFNYAPTTEDPFAVETERFEKYYTAPDLAIDSWVPVRSLPVKINNHKELRSCDPTVCVIPGQCYKDGYDDALNVSKLHVNLIQSRNNKIQTGNPDPALWSGLVEHTLDQLPQKFSHDATMSAFGYAGNILVHTDIIKEYALNSKTLNHFYNGILDEIARACGNYWNLGVFIDAEKDYIGRILDDEWTKNVKETSDIIWKFPLWDKAPFLKGFSLASKIPDSMKLMALYGTNSAMVNQNYSKNELFPIQGISGLAWADLAMENVRYEASPELADGTGAMTYTGYEAVGKAVGKKDSSNIKHYKDMTLEAQVLQLDKLEEILMEEGSSGGDIDGSHSENMMQLLECVLNNVNVLTEEKFKEKTEAGKVPSYEEQKELEKEMHSALLEENPNIFRKIIPIDCSFSIDGLSGIYYGNSFAIDGLPARYYKTVATEQKGTEPLVCFQIKNVKHDIDFNGWTTTIDALMRMTPDGASVKDINGPYMNHQHPDNA
jgi:hypothetical protein